MDPTSGMSLLPNDNDPAAFAVPNPNTDHDAFVTADHPADDSMYFLFPNASPVTVPTEVLNPHIVHHHSTSTVPHVFTPEDLSMGLTAHLSSVSSTTTPSSNKRKREDNLVDLLPPTSFFTPAPKRSRTENFENEQIILGSSPTSPASNDDTPVITPTSTPAPSKPKSPRPARKTTRKSTILSNSPPTNGNDTGKKRLRTLSHMQSLARSHAPEVALSSEELLEIASMREHEDELALSAELYRELVQFKAVLATHGYRLSALTIDPITEEASTPEQLQGLPVDLVLKRRVKPTVFVPSSPYTGDGNLLSPITPPGTSSKGRKKSKAPRGADDKAHNAAGTGVTCVVCTKSMNDMETLVRHFRHVHQELKPYNCPRCKGPYSSEGTLWHHIRNVHSETPRKFRCSQCDASYDSFGAKTRHEHATHNTDQPEFTCTFEGCNRAFNFPAHLESHAISDHPGFKPFGCTKCKKRFNSANGLIRHKREVHQSTRAYSCSCGTTFKKKDHLKRHLLQRHSMSYEKATEEMKKQPSPGLAQFMPPAAPAAAEAV